MELTRDLENKVREALRDVYDPETGLNLLEMNLITKIKELGEGFVEVEFTPSSPICPIAFYLANEIKNKTLAVEGVRKARIICKGHMMESQINSMVNADLT